MSEILLKWLVASFIFFFLLWSVVRSFIMVHRYNIFQELLRKNLYELRNEEGQVFYRIDCGHPRPHDEFRLKQIRKITNDRLR